MKRIVYFCFFLLLNFSLFAEDDITILLDQAKNEYLNKNFEESKRLSKEFYDKLSIMIFNNENQDFEEVDFARLKTFPMKYINKKLCLKSICLSPNRIIKFNDSNNYKISIYTINQADAFYNESFDENSVIFFISESLLDKLIDEVQAGYVGYFNIYTDIIYQAYDNDPLDNRKQYLFAKIIKLEGLKVDKYSGKSLPSGVVLFD